MSEWIFRDKADWRLPVKEGTVVHALYEDEAGYQTLPAQCVEWGRTRNPVVLWRVSFEHPFGTNAG